MSELKASERRSKERKGVSVANIYISKETYTATAPSIFSIVNNTTAPVQKQPAFETIFALAALLSLAYVLNRKKR